MLNKVQIIGNLGAKPEMKYLESGQPVCDLRVAANETWKDKDGEKQERTEWFRVVAWGKLAEICAQYLDKGKSVYVEGRLQTRSWEADGETRYMTEVVAQTIRFLGGKSGKWEGDDESEGETRKPTPSKAPSKSKPASPKPTPRRR